MDAISQASGVPTAYPNYPPNWRAIQLPDTKVASTFWTSSAGRNETRRVNASGPAPPAWCRRCI